VHYNTVLTSDLGLAAKDDGGLILIYIQQSWGPQHFRIYTRDNFLLISEINETKQPTGNIFVSRRRSVSH